MKQQVLTEAILGCVQIPHSTGDTQVIIEIPVCEALDHVLEVLDEREAATQ